MLHLQRKTHCHTSHHCIQVSDSTLPSQTSPIPPRTAALPVSSQGWHFWRCLFVPLHKLILKSTSSQIHNGMVLCIAITPYIEREREHIFFFLTNDPLQNRSYFRPSSAKLRGESWFFSYGTVKIHFKNPLDSSKNTSRAVESSPWLLLRCHCTQVPHIPWSRYILRHGKSDKGVVSLGGRCLSQESPCLMHTNPGSFPYNHRFTNGHWEQCLTESKTSNSCLGWFDSKATNQSPFSPSHGALNSPKKYEVRRDDRLWMYTIFVPKNSLAGFGHQSPSGRSLFFFLSSKCPSPKSSPRWAALKVTKRLGKTSSCGAMWEDIVCCFLQLPGLAEFEVDFMLEVEKEPIVFEGSLP